MTEQPPRAAADLPPSLFEVAALRVLARSSLAFLRELLAYAEHHGDEELARLARQAVVWREAAGPSGT
jgi:hypothetical protein